MYIKFKFCYGKVNLFYLSNLDGFLTTKESEHFTLQCYLDVVFCDENSS